ncbi:hypothetical protein Tco_0388960 [Tanacetum coccineum]
MILSGADNRPPMLDKDLYDSWKSRMELYMQNREHGRMILESVENGPLIWPSVKENGVTRTKKYVELSAAEKIQVDCDMKVTNIILQGLPSYIYSLMNHHRVSKDLQERVQLLMQGFVVLVFSPGDDPIACLNKAMAFLTVVASSRFPSTNNQHRTSLNPRNHATIQDGREEHPALGQPPVQPVTPDRPLAQYQSTTPPNSPTHIEIPESCLPLRKRVHFASPTPSCEVGESSVAGAARDRPVHRRLAVMIEREAKMARETWGLSMDASDYARLDVMSLRTTVVAQSALISELQSADHRRQRTQMVELHSQLGTRKRSRHQLDGNQERLVAVPRFGLCCTKLCILLPILPKMPPLNFQATEGVDGLTQLVRKEGVRFTAYGNCNSSMPGCAVEFATKNSGQKINTWSEATTKESPDAPPGTTKFSIQTRDQTTGRALSAGNE